MVDQGVLAPRKVELALGLRYGFFQVLSDEVCRAEQQPDLLDQTRVRRTEHLFELMSGKKWGVGRRLEVFSLFRTTAQLVSLIMRALEEGLRNFAESREVRRRADLVPDAVEQQEVEEGLQVVPELVPLDLSAHGGGHEHPCPLVVIIISSKPGHVGLGRVRTDLPS